MMVNGNDRAGRTSGNVPGRALLGVPGARQVGCPRGMRVASRRTRRRAARSAFHTSFNTSDRETETWSSFTEDPDSGTPGSRSLPTSTKTLPVRFTRPMTRRRTLTVSSALQNVRGAVSLERHTSNISSRIAGQLELRLPPSCCAIIE